MPESLRVEPLGRYTPGTRQIPPAREIVRDSISWWMKPDADWPSEFERMRNARGPRIPSAENIIGMAGVW